MSDSYFLGISFEMAGKELIKKLSCGKSSVSWSEACPFCAQVDANHQLPACTHRCKLLWVLQRCTNQTQSENSGAKSNQRFRCRALMNCDKHSLDVRALC